MLLNRELFRSFSAQVSNFGGEDAFYNIEVRKDDILIVTTSDHTDWLYSRYRRSDDEVFDDIGTLFFKGFSRVSKGLGLFQDDDNLIDVNLKGNLLEFESTSSSDSFGIGLCEEKIVPKSISSKRYSVMSKYNVVSHKVMPPDFLRRIREGAFVCGGADRVEISPEEGGKSMSFRFKRPVGGGYATIELPGDIKGEPLDVDVDIFVRTSSFNFLKAKDDVTMIFFENGVIGLRLVTNSSDFYYCISRLAN